MSTSMTRIDPLAMHKLTSSDLAEVEQRLRSMRLAVLDAVQARLARQGACAGPPHSLRGLLEVGEQPLEHMLTDQEIGVVRHELDTLREIDAAIKRIEFDVGGICNACGAVIAIERLRALPTAATCARCATSRAH